MDWIIWGKVKRQRRDKQMEEIKAGRDGDNSVRIYRENMF